MYSFIWRSLPRPKWLRVIISLILVAAVLYACFEWLFPWLANYVTFNDNTVG